LKTETIQNKAKINKKYLKTNNALVFLYYQITMQSMMFVDFGWSFQFILIAC